MDSITKDEVISRLLKDIGKEVDYWMLDSNKDDREAEYGHLFVKKMNIRYKKLRNKLLETISLLPEVK